MLLSSSCSAAGSAVSGEIMLFGVRVVVDSMRKSVSMNNLSQYELPRDAANAKDDVAAGYASADDAAPINSGKNRDRKRGPTNAFQNSLSLSATLCYFNKLVLCFVFFLHIIDWSLHQKLDAFIFIIIFLINHLDVFIRLYLNTSFLSVMIADFNY